MIKKEGKTYLCYKKEIKILFHNDKAELIKKFYILYNEKGNFLF